MIYVLSGGGGKLYAAIGVTYPVGAVCTCAKSGKTQKASNTSGRWVFPVSETGTYTVSITNGNETASSSVSIAAQGQVVSVTLTFKVPAEYQLLQYIELKSGAYIDTAVTGEACRIRTEYAPLNVAAGNLNVVCGQSNSNQWEAPCTLLVDGVKFYAEQHLTASWSVASGTWYNIDYNGAGNKLIINGTTSTFTLTQNALSGRLRICAMSGTNGSGRYKHFTVYRKSNGVLLREMYPCRRRSDNVVGMWDRVGQQFYTNAGAGTVVAGGNA